MARVTIALVLLAMLLLACIVARTVDAPVGTISTVAGDGWAKDMVELAVSAGSDYNVFERPRQPVQVQISVRNLVPIARPGLQLSCAVKGEERQAIKEFSQELDLAPSERKTITLTVIPPRVGSYHVEAKLTGGVALASTAQFEVGLTD